MAPNFKKGLDSSRDWGLRSSVPKTLTLSLLHFYNYTKNNYYHAERSRPLL